MFRHVEELVGRAQMTAYCLSFFCGVACNAFLSQQQNNEMEYRNHVYFATLALFVFDSPRPYLMSFAAGALSAEHSSSIWGSFNDLARGSSTLSVGSGEPTSMEL